MEFADRQPPLTPVRTSHADHRVERVERVRHVARVGGNARITPAEDRVDAVEALERAAAASGLPFVARHGRVVEVLAPRALQQVAAIGRHVAQLARGAGEDGLCQQRILLPDERVIGGVTVRREGPDGHAAARAHDLGQPQPGQIHELGGALDVLLHQVEEVRAAGQELRLRVRGD
jgi:hypothetical protein